jgi:hypothetical protein
MKTLSILTLALSAVLVSCNIAPKIEQPEINPPSDTSLLGTYSIIEETVSGLPLAESTLSSSRIEIQKDGKAQFTDFPMFVRKVGLQGIPRKVTQSGHWLVSPNNSSGYCVFLDPDNEGRMKAVIVEGGDLIIYYAPSGDGFFSKWRKVNP